MGGLRHRGGLRKSRILTHFQGGNGRIHTHYEITIRAAGTRDDSASELREMTTRAPGKRYSHTRALRNPHVKKLNHGIFDFGLRNYGIRS